MMLRTSIISTMLISTTKNRSLVLWVRFWGFLKIQTATRIFWKSSIIAITKPPNLTTKYPIWPTYFCKMRVLGQILELCMFWVRLKLLGAIYSPYWNGVGVAGIVLISDILFCFGFLRCNFAVLKTLGDSYSSSSCYIGKQGNSKFRTWR